MQRASHTIRYTPIILITLTLFLRLGIAASSFRIDGDFADWNGVETLARDPKGDATGAFDVTQVFAASRGSMLYLRFDTGTVLNIQNGPDNEGTLLIQLDLPSQKQLILDTRGRQAYVSDKRDVRIPWAHLKYVVGPTYAQDEFEIQIDLGLFDVGPGDSVQIQLGGSDQLDRPVAYTLSQPSTPPAHRSSHRQSGTDVRIVSFNTYVEGLSDPNRAQAMRRLLNAAGGDIYCFQEEWDSTGIADIMSRLVPLDRGRSWYVHKVRGNVIASKYPLKALPSRNNSYAAACVDLRGKPLVVMSVHLSAMGYIQSKEDLWRIQQAKTIREAVDGIYAGAYDDVIPSRTKPGLVMVGDFNLVGSRTPIDLLIHEKTAGLKDWLVRNLVGESVTTWRGGLNSG
ncbi:MAG: hypothetical protein HQ515_02350, partial [Phycisphaeraceae bacterium]|nr:hypothetical protein [Phycisphaeraceae bacterium]